MSSPSPEAAILDALLAELDQYRPQGPVPPAPPAPLPRSSLSLVSVEERTVGLGARVGADTRGPFSVAELKGIRVESVVRYYIFSTTPDAVEVAVQDLTRRLLGDRNALRKAGFLQVSLKDTGATENVALNAWRAGVDFEVLYEFPYTDSDGAESLIARIPIDISGQFGESTLVHDEMVRWDNESAPGLALRGPSTIGKLSALRFTPAAVPTGAVKITRTFDGAAGPDPVYPDLASLLADISRPGNPERQGEVTFPSLTEFLDALSLSGGSITLGDWDKDLTPDIYESRALTLDPAVNLPSVEDRLEISYDLTPSNIDFVVVYLRATRGPAS